MHTCCQIVHKDIKPANILISENDELKLADFGISELVSESGTTSQKAGTYYFLPPEVFSQDKVDAKGIDIWSMGITLYYLLFGEPPFRNPDFKFKVDRME